MYPDERLKNDVELVSWGCALTKTRLIFVCTPKKKTSMIVWALIRTWDPCRMPPETLRASDVTGGEDDESKDGNG